MKYSIIGCKVNFSCVRFSLFCRLDHQLLFRRWTCASPQNSSSQGGLRGWQNRAYRPLLFLVGKTAWQPLFIIAERDDSKQQSVTMLMCCHDNILLTQLAFYLFKSNISLKFINNTIFSDLGQLVRQRKSPHRSGTSYFLLVLIWTRCKCSLPKHFWLLRESLFVC